MSSHLRMSSEPVATNKLKCLQADPDAELDALLPALLDRALWQLSKEKQP